jgi:hypothetical protein
MMKAVRTSETSVDNHFTRQYIPEDNSEHHTRRRENLTTYTLLLTNYYYYYYYFVCAVSVIGRLAVGTAH